MWQASVVLNTLKPNSLEHSTCWILHEFYRHIKHSSIRLLLPTRDGRNQGCPESCSGSATFAAAGPRLRNLQFHAARWPMLWNMQFCAVKCPELRIRNGTAARAVSRPLGPPDGSQVANTRPQDASKNPPSETSESCTFLARSGGLAEHVPNREWWVLHWFYSVF